MNLNLLTYILYLGLMAAIIFRVGWMFYVHGQVYIDRMLPARPEYARWLNKMLLMAYYLFNLGYVAFILHSWEPVKDIRTMFDTLTGTMGGIILLLAIMHYFNLCWIYLLQRHRTKNLQTTNPRNHD